MSLEHFIKKIKPKAILINRLVLFSFFLLCTSLSFALSKVSSILEKKEQIIISQKIFDADFDFLGRVEGDAKEVGASINGTKYYYPSCAGIKRIKAKNLIYFSSSEAAEQQGYTLAANCQNY